MNKISKQRTVNGSAKATEQMQNTAPGPFVPPFTKVDRKQDPRETAQEGVHQVTPRASIDVPASPYPEAGTAKAPLRAASGDDDLMSKQQQQAMPSVDELKGKWKQQVGAAKIAWGKLTEDELLKSEGHAQKLAGLVQERYAITRDEADKQIKKFFDTQAS